MKKDTDKNIDKIKNIKLSNIMESPICQPVYIFKDKILENIKKNRGK